MFFFVLVFLPLCGWIRHSRRESRTSQIWTSGDISPVPTRNNVILGVRFRVEIRVRVRIRLEFGLRVRVEIGFRMGINSLIPTGIVK